jgi:hypothetical protein
MIYWHLLYCSIAVYKVVLPPSLFVGHQKTVIPLVDMLSGRP